MKFKLLITAKTYDYSNAAGNGPFTAAPFNHQVVIPATQSVSIEVVEFDTFEEAEYAVTQIATVGHVVTRLYKVPSTHSEYWTPNIPTGI
jgi:hypothetical protein